MQEKEPCPLCLQYKCEHRTEPKEGTVKVPPVQMPGKDDGFSIPKEGTEKWEKIVKAVEGVYVHGKRNSTDVFNLPEDECTINECLEKIQKLISQTLETERLRIENEVENLPAYSNREFAETKRGLFLKLEEVVEIIRPKI